MTIYSLTLNTNLNSSKVCVIGGYLTLNCKIYRG